MNSTNLSNWEMKRGKKFDFWTAVSEGLGIIICLKTPALLLCSKPGFYIPLRLMRAVSGPVVVILTN